MADAEPKAPSKKGRGGDSHIVQLRRQRVMELMAKECRGRQSIFKIIHEEFGVCIESVDKDIAACRKELVKSLDVERVDMVAQMIAQADAILEASMDAKQFAAACGIWASKAKALGIQDPSNASPKRKNKRST